MIRVGVVGDKRDEHVRSLVRAFAARGAEAVVLDFRGFPLHTLASFSTRHGASFDDIEQRGTADLTSLSGAIVRTTFGGDLAPERAAQADAAAVWAHYRHETARIAFQKSFFQWLSCRVPMVNPPHAHRYHGMKGLQHQLLLDNDLPTPRALATNDLARARLFVQSLNHKAIAKPQAGGAEVVRADDAFFDSSAELLRERPFLFQQLVSGRSMRAYVLGGEIAACFELFHDRRFVDWRERTTGTAPFEPSDELREQIRRAARLLDLPYCGIDLEWDNDTGRFYFLDFNPSALFVGASRMTGVDLAGAIAGYLLMVIHRDGALFSA